MSDQQTIPADSVSSPLVALAGSGFSRIANAALSEGNAIELLRDGPVNFPRWLEAIAAADTLLLTVPNQLGVDYNAHVLDSVLRYVAPELGWR